MLSDVAIKQENTALKEKADSLAQINSKIHPNHTRGSHIFQCYTSVYLG